MIQDHHVFHLGNGYGHFVYMEPPQERILNHHHHHHHDHNNNNNNITFTSYQKMLEYEIWHCEENKEREKYGRIVVVQKVEGKNEEVQKNEYDDNKDNDEENEIILYERMKKIEIIVLISIIVLLNLFYVFFL